MENLEVDYSRKPKEWITCQGPYVEALAAYWKREWKAKSESDVIAEFQSAGVDVCLVALDLSTSIGTPPCSNDYVAALRDRHTCVVQAWGAVEPHSKLILVPSGVTPMVTISAPSSHSTSGATL